MLLVVFFVLYKRVYLLALHLNHTAIKQVNEGLKKLLIRLILSQLQIGTLVYVLFFKNFSIK